MKRLQETIELVEYWFHNVGLTQKGTPVKQAEKGVEEAKEFLEACKLGDREKMVDELGDRFVTLIGSSLLSDIPLEEALYFAYEKINERVKSGRVINGTFVKKEDLECQ